MGIASYDFIGDRRVSSSVIISRLLLFISDKDNSNSCKIDAKFRAAEKYQELDNNNK